MSNVAFFSLLHMDCDIVIGQCHQCHPILCHTSATHLWEVVKSIKLYLYYLNYNFSLPLISTRSHIRFVFVGLNLNGIPHAKYCIQMIMYVNVYTSLNELFMFFVIVYNNKMLILLLE